VVYTCVLAALGQLNPARAVAPSGFGTGAIAVGYPRSRSGKPMVQYELMTTSLGGTSRHDGASIVMAMNHYTPSTPVEILESEYPLLVRRFDFARDSAGAGRHRGGVGYVREYEFLDDCILTVRTSNQRFGAWGLLGGKGPRTSRTVVNPDGPDREDLGILETRQIKPGTVVRWEQSGGGGYGDPLERPVEAVVEDVENGYISVESAAADYGVVIDPASRAVDRDATRARRSGRTG
jgi:N-methylhydantoinase B